mgnify:CR=1 FL=1
MKINDHAIQINAGYISIGEPLEMGDTVTVVVEGEVTQIKQNDNQDGTYDVIYKIKGSIADIKKHNVSLASEETL